MLPKKTMAMVQTGPRKLERRDLPIPAISDDSAIIRIEACGICGSDYEQYEGVLNTPMPVIPGHEPLGIIEAIGDKRQNGVSMLATVSQWRRCSRAIPATRACLAVTTFATAVRYILISR